MGNANTHVGLSEHASIRRKSKESGHHSLSSHALGVPATYDDAIIGPVDITAGVRNNNNTSLSPGIRNIPPHRPRATTEVSRRPPKSVEEGFLKKSHNSGSSDSDRAGATNGSHAAGRRLEKEASLPFGSSAGARMIGDITGKALLESGEKVMPTIFKYSGDAKEVYVSGSFNNWGRLPMSRSTKDFVAIVNLQEGEHEYKFVVDGEWINDKGTDIKDGNNVIRVQKEDFNAYAALDMDSKAVSLAMDKKRNPGGGPSHPAEFGQDVPEQGTFTHRSGPPILPPHLLQVILNKDTPLSCEPTLLPEPNHVMLNHLYALSIKDGVMVMSSTQRYRKKYVTTLLYKPMGARKTDVAA